MVDGESPILRRDRGRDVVVIIVFLLDIGGEKTCCGTHDGINAPEVQLVVCIEKLPPKALHCPWSHADLISPRWNRVWDDLAGHRIGGQWIKRSRHIEIVTRESF